MGSKFGMSMDYMNRQKELHKVKHKDCPVVIVTGADNEGSIGLEIAQYLSERNYIVDHSTKEKLDVTNPIYDFSPYNALVMSHGVSWLDWIEYIPPEKIRETIDVNLTGSILTSQKFIQQQIDTRFKKYIIMIGSMAAFGVLNASASYCASKAGLAHYVKCLGWELAPKGFYVFGIHPSNTVDTPMAEETIQGIMRYRKISKKEAEDYWASILPLPNWLTKADIARLVDRILSGEMDYLTGTNIQLAGGQR